jgi:cellulose synthase/poly-beta-1,6-N-acetylglucosamine synthase-like glycosyltransferase
MESMAFLLLGFYFLLLALLALFGLHRYYLSYLYYKHQNRRPRDVPGFGDLPQLPFVTVQLPIYNEKYVVERLLKQVCAIDYPRDRLEIQLLDDSTDETQEIAKGVVRDCIELGHPVVYLHRSNRQGFKAGALDEGMKVAKGELIAIFDADFLPEADFLTKMVPYFFIPKKKYGMVQARWGHLNQDYSLMTQAQSILLDGHFVIEHTARNRSGRFFNFNGTAGIWDRRCIEAAGGWQHDTLTEDLDLSYRAQLKGWKFLYVPEVVVPAELPVDMNGFKSQQHRWAKGSIQTAKKLMPRIWRSALPNRIKAEASFHLLNNLAYVLMVLLAFCMPLSLYLRHQLHLQSVIWIDLPIFLLATVSISTFYICSQREIYPDWKSRLLYLPLNLALGIGLAVNNTKAVCEALLGRESEFTRTAKYAIAAKSDGWQNKKYRSNFSVVTFVEIFFGIYFSGAVVYAFIHGLWMSLYSLLFFQVGFFYVGLLSLFQGKPMLSAAPALSASSVPVE